jgi:hypothetical protein
MLRETSLAVAAAAFLFSGAVEAEPATGTQWTFVTVDSVEMSGDDLTITGILKDQASPSTLTFYVRIYSSQTSPSQPSDHIRVESCVKYALLALNKPGQFVLELRRVSDYYFYDVSCKLSRATP